MTDPVEGKKYRIELTGKVVAIDDRMAMIKLPDRSQQGIPIDSFAWEEIEEFERGRVYVDHVDDRYLYLPGYKDDRTPWLDLSDLKWEIFDTPRRPLRPYGEDGNDQ